MAHITLEDCVKFHGHICGGIASGYAISRYAMDLIGAKEGDSLIAKVECQNCMADGVQLVTGCTVGKGNLIIDDVGKSALTLVNGKTGEGVRVIIDISAIEGETKEEMAHNVVNADPATICKYREATLPIKPKMPKASVICDKCHEKLTAHYAVEKDGKTLCRHCAQ